MEPELTFAELADIAAGEVARLRVNLPADIAKAAAPVAVHFDDFPSDDLIAAGYDDDLLGLFDGVAYNDEPSAGTPSAPQIFLYLENIYDFVDGDPVEFREEVRLTYLHELGHYLGWDEDDMEARGLD